ncbi:uncharacterized protein LOC135091525 [Scylla paramamosain]|uniref:uncharacterized protein LOC135091525 n=1 Tax=Scylla paramamosain TaxID=85552 RepID=UPI0030827690
MLTQNRPPPPPPPLPNAVSRLECVTSLPGMSPSSHTLTPSTSQQHLQYYTSEPPPECGYCEALLAFTLHPLRPPVITSPFQRRHYCDGYAAFEESSSRPSLGRTRLTLAALLGPFHDSQREREVEVRWSRGGRLKEAVKE